MKKRKKNQLHFFFANEKCRSRSPDSLSFSLSTRHSLVRVVPVPRVELEPRVLAHGRALPARAAQVDELDGAAEGGILLASRRGHDGAVDLNGLGVGDPVHGGLGVAVERAVGLFEFFILF